MHWRWGRPPRIRAKADCEVWNAGSGWARPGWRQRHRKLPAPHTAGLPHLSAPSSKRGEASPVSTSFTGSTRPGTHPSASKCRLEWTLKASPKQIPLQNRAPRAYRRHQKWAEPQNHGRSTGRTLFSLYGPPQLLLELITKSHEVAGYKINGIEKSPEINSRVYDQVTFDKGAKTTHRARTGPSTSPVGKPNSHVHKNGVGPLSHKQ